MWCYSDIKLLCVCVSTVSSKIIVKCTSKDKRKFCHLTIGRAISTIDDGLENPSKLLQLVFLVMINKNFLLSFAVIFCSVNMLLCFHHLRPSISDHSFSHAGESEASSRLLQDRESTDGPADHSWGEACSWTSWKTSFITLLTCHKVSEMLKKESF